MDFDENRSDLVAFNEDFEAASTAAAQRFMDDDVTDAPPQYPPEKHAETPLVGVQVKNVGDVASMDIPDNWRSEPEKGAAEARGRSTGFNPPKTPDARLVLNLSAGEANEQTAAALRKITAPSTNHHDLTRDEIASLRSALGPLADSSVFNLQAKTLDLNGRTVVAYEGSLKDGDRRIKGYLTTTANNEIQQVFFSAPGEAFKNHLDTAQTAFRSIEWSGAKRPAPKASSEIK